MTSRWVWTLLVLSIIQVNHVFSQAVEGVCNMPSSKDPNHTLPRFSDVFAVDVEAKFEELNATRYFRQHYDLKRNRASLIVKAPFMPPQLYYMNYDNNNFLHVDSDSSSCAVSPMSTAKDRFIFGFRNDSGYGQVHSPLGAFHFATATQIYTGVWDTRGITCDVWVSCQYIDSIQATAQVTWYISRKDVWDMQIGTGNVPVRLVATGIQVTPNNSMVNFTHIYDFFNYESSIRPTDFEVPDGVYCPNRGSSPDHPFPQIPDAFYFIGEIIDPYKTQFTYLEEGYDNNTKVSMFRFKGDTTTLTTMGEWLEMNDYNTGVSYLMDTNAGSCVLSPVNQGFVQYSIGIGNGQVRMKTPREFLMDSSIQYQYAGSSTIRQIPCERWVGTTTNAPGYNNTVVNVEWYYAAEVTYSWSTGDSAGNNYRLPILFRLYIPGDITSPGYDFHIYYFNVAPSLASFKELIDITACYYGAGMMTIRFRFDKSNELTLSQNEMNSVLAIKNVIALSTGTSSLRINNVHFYFNPDYVWVTFDLLDKAPSYHDVVTNDVENDLNGAWSMLQGAFQLKTLTFPFAAGTQVLTLTPIWDSLEMMVNGTVSGYQAATGADTSSSYSAGALAGLGVAMLIIGGAAGAGGGKFFFLK